MEGRGGEKLLAADGEHAIECDVHVRIKVSKGRRKSVLSAVRDYRVLAVFTET